MCNGWFYVQIAGAVFIAGLGLLLVVAAIALFKELVLEN